MLLPSRLRVELKTLAWKREKGTSLKVFSGKEEALNRLILLILRLKRKLAKYDMAIEVRHIRDFKHIDTNTVYRRMDALQQQGWIGIVGERPTKPGWPSELYGLTLKGKAALKLDERNIDDFLSTASDEQLRKLIDALSK